MMGDDDICNTTKISTDKLKPNGNKNTCDSNNALCTNNSTVPYKFNESADAAIVTWLAQYDPSSLPPTLSETFRLGPIQSSLGITKPIVWLANLSCDFQKAYTTIDDPHNVLGPTHGGRRRIEDGKRTYPRNFTKSEQDRFDKLQDMYHNQRWHNLLALGYDPATAATMVGAIRENGQALFSPPPLFALSPRMVVTEFCKRFDMAQILSNYLDERAEIAERELLDDLDREEMCETKKRNNKKKKARNKKKKQQQQSEQYQRNLDHQEIGIEPKLEEPVALKSNAINTENISQPSALIDSPPHNKNQLPTHETLEQKRKRIELAVAEARRKQNELVQQKSLQIQQNKEEQQPTPISLSTTKTRVFTKEDKEIIEKARLTKLADIAAATSTSTAIKSATTNVSLESASLQNDYKALKAETGLSNFDGSQRQKQQLHKMQPQKEQQQNGAPAELDDEVRGPPPPLVPTEEEDTPQVGYAWCCDYCKKATFPTFAEAALHEFKCKVIIEGGRGVDDVEDNHSKDAIVADEKDVVENGVAADKYGILKSNKNKNEVKPECAVQLMGEKQSTMNGEGKVLDHNHTKRISQIESNCSKDSVFKRVDGTSNNAIKQRSGNESEAKRQDENVSRHKSPKKKKRTKNKSNANKLTNNNDSYDEKSKSSASLSHKLTDEPTNTPIIVKENAIHPTAQNTSLSPQATLSNKNNQEISALITNMNGITLSGVEPSTPPILPDGKPPPPSSSKNEHVTSSSMEDGLVQDMKPLAMQDGNQDFGNAKLANASGVTFNVSSPKSIDPPLDDSVTPNVASSATEPESKPTPTLSPNILSIEKSIDSEISSRLAALAAENESLRRTLALERQRAAEAVQRVQLKAYIGETARDAAEERASWLENILIDSVTEMVTKEVVRREMKEVVAAVAYSTAHTNPPPPLPQTMPPPYHFHPQSPPASTLLPSGVLPPLPHDFLGPLGEAGTSFPNNPQPYYNPNHRQAEQYVTPGNPGPRDSWVGQQLSHQVPWVRDDDPLDARREGVLSRLRRGAGANGQIM